MNSILENLPKPYFLHEGDGRFAALYQGDSLTLLDLIPEESIDLIFADPPYFLSNGGITCHSGKMVSVDKGDWDKVEGFAQIEEFNEAWLSKCRKVLKPDGSIWVSGTFHNIYTIGHLMNKVGYKILNDVIWEKPNPPPNLSCRYLTHSTEILLWAAKDDRSKHTFNYQWAKIKNKGKQMKNVWRIKPTSSQEKIYGIHPTQKPENLIDYIINVSSLEKDLVLDPFNGSGTTTVVAARNKRSTIGFDLLNEFNTIAEQRLVAELSQKKII